MGCLIVYNNINSQDVKKKYEHFFDERRWTELIQ